MKKLFITLFIILWAGSASAAEYMAEWDQVLFEDYNSDPSSSGYRLYESTDDGTTKTLLGEVPASDTSYIFNKDSIDGYCFFVTAFNQWGESGFSPAYCTNTPDTPQGFVIKLLQQITQILTEIRDKL